MEYLQYLRANCDGYDSESFKPCYKWNTFNTIVSDIAPTLRRIEF